MNIETVISELIRDAVITDGETSYRSLKGGTVSDVYLLESAGRKYVVKGNTEAVIRSEVDFLRYYEGLHMMPELLYTDALYQYIVYAFIEGEAEYRGGKKEVLKILVSQLINHYRPAKNNGWGWVDEPSDSWQDFQTKEVAYAHPIIGSHLEDEVHAFIANLSLHSTFKGSRYLLHGDCGMHNFIFSEGILHGVIDPTPVIGDPVYDLIYAFCSSPEDLTKETVLEGFQLLRVGQAGEQELFEQILIALYIRLETCLRHHPEDFREYINAFHYWYSIVKTKM